MLHRPGNELKRLTPRNNDKLLFDGIPWVHRAQEEHDAFAEALRSREVEVLYLTDLLTEALQQDQARNHAITTALGGLHLGDTMRSYLARVLQEAPPEELTGYLTAGIRNDEVRGGFGLVTSLLAHDDFLIDPLPNLLFTRDSSVWIRDRVAITSLAMPARSRETQLTELIYTAHPRFQGTRKIHGWHHEHVEGGDVLLLAPGVIAVGVGERTTPAGVERLARQVFHASLAHTVLAVPIAQERATMHLDTVCTMVDVDNAGRCARSGFDALGGRREGGITAARVLGRGDSSHQFGIINQSLMALESPGALPSMTLPPTIFDERRTQLRELMNHLEGGARAVEFASALEPVLNTLGERFEVVLDEMRSGPHPKH